MKHVFLSSFFVILFSNCFSQSIINIGTTSVEVDTVITSLDIPWEITWGPDNHIWMTERKGLVSRVNPGTGDRDIILDIVSTVYQQSESGLLGLVLHPDFATTPEVFIAYTFGSSGNIRERLVKYTYDGANLINPQTLIDEIPGNSTHNGARLVFLPDGTLLMSTGDAQIGSAPQNLSSLNGKIIRLNTDGSIPVDNPFADSYVYAYGLRNTQGLVVINDGRVFSTEHGPNTDDEFQLISSGRNYGWPDVEGFCQTPYEIQFCADNNVKEPIVVWTPTIAPSDLVYYENPDFPEWNNAFLLSILKDKKLVALKMNITMDEVIDETHYLTDMFGRLRDICIGPDKEIYLATNGPLWSNTQPNTHSIIRLKPIVGSASLSEYSNGKISVYPNPVTDELTIKFDVEMKGDFDLIVYDQSGRKVVAETTNQNLSSINLNQLENGVYFLSIQQDGMLFLSKKLVKN